MLANLLAQLKKRASRGNQEWVANGLKMKRTCEYIQCLKRERRLQNKIENMDEECHPREKSCNLQLRQKQLMRSLQ